jgi:putative membrane protein
MRASIALMGFGLVILRLRTASSMVLEVCQSNNYG